MTFYENNEEVRPTGAEGGEVLDSPPHRDRGRPDEDEREDTDPGLDTTNLPGDNRAPATARPLRHDSDDSE